MKFVLSMAAILVSFQAMADAKFERVACQLNDYQKIEKALKTLRIVSGQQHLNDLNSLLQEEMGPTCNQLISTEIMVTIPGSQVSMYEIKGGGNRNFYLEISINRIERSGNSVVITRK